LLFFAAFAVHAYVGLRDVILDYVPPRAGRVTLLGGVTLALAAFAGWGVLWLVQL
jgi:succinate dehydrogenase / fumarate reductase membrane anchor subunit